MAVKNQFENTYGNRDFTQGGPVFNEDQDNGPVEPPPPAQAPAAPKAAPRISSGWGNTDPRGIEDMWFQFLNSSGKAQGASGAGAYKGGGSYRGNLGGLVNEFNDATGLNAKVAGEDFIDFGFGKQDVIKSGSNDWWLGARGGIEPSAAQGGGGTAGGTYNHSTNNGAGGGSSSSTTTSTGSTVPLSSGPTPPGVSAELYRQLMERAHQGTQIDPNDPNIKQQTEPYAAAQERARRNYLADTAERRGNLANMQGEARMASEKAGQNTGMFQSQLVGRELENRRAEITHALDSLGTRLTEDQRMGLQRELAIMEDATQRYGIDSNANIANGQLSLGRDRLGLDYTDQDWRMDPRNPSNIPMFNGV